MQKGEVFFNLPYVISCETLVRGPKHVPLDFHHVLNLKIQNVSRGTESRDGTSISFTVQHIHVLAP
jgi:hypothetical protein